MRKLSEALVLGLRRRYSVQVQDAVAVSGWQGKDAPEVDVAVIADKFYRPGPTAADAFAFLEVSDTTYTDDRNEQIPLYVNAGVRSWIVNIPLRQVEFFGSVADLAKRYGNVFSEEETFDVLGVAIPVADLFDRDADGSPIQADPK